MEVSLYRWEERGGAFFLIFILFTVLIGLPLLIAEFMIGRSTQKQAVGAFIKYCTKYRMALDWTPWCWNVFYITFVYSVVGGWVFIYLFRGVTGQLITPGQKLRCIIY